MISTCLVMATLCFLGNQDTSIQFNFAYSNGSKLEILYDTLECGIEEMILRGESLICKKSGRARRVELRLDSGALVNSKNRVRFRGAAISSEEARLSYSIAVGPSEAEVTECFRRSERDGRIGYLYDVQVDCPERVLEVFYNHLVFSRHGIAKAITIHPSHMAFNPPAYFEWGLHQTQRFRLFDTSSGFHMVWFPDFVSVIAVPWPPYGFEAWGGYANTVMLPQARQTGEYVLYTPQFSKSKGSAQVSVYVPNSGRYSLWARCLWEDTGSNSFFAGFDDLEWSILGNDDLFGEWHWVEGPTAELEEGWHDVVIATREAGAALGGMVLTSSDLYPSLDERGAGSYSLGTILDVSAVPSVHPPMVAEMSDYASNGAYVGVQGRRRNPPLYREYRFAIQREVEYFLWLRCWWEDEQGNSFFISSNTDEDEFEFGNTLEPMRTWHWVRVSRPFVSRDADILVVKVRCREDGALLDKLILTDDRNYVPTGLGEMYGSTQHVEAEDGTADEQEEIRFSLTFKENNRKFRSPSVLVLFGESGDEWESYYFAYDLVREELRDRFGVTPSVEEPRLMFWRDDWSHYDFQRIEREVLDLCVSLNIPVISLNNVFEYNPRGNGYNTTNYSIRDDIGGRVCLERLCSAAHKKGLKIELWFYTDSDSSYDLDRDGVADGFNHQWFVRAEDGSFYKPFDDHVWNLGNRQVREILLRAIEHLKKLGVDQILLTPGDEAYLWDYSEGSNNAPQSAYYWRVVREIQKMGLKVSAECPKPLIGNSRKMQPGMPGTFIEYDLYGISAAKLRQALLMGQTMNYRTADVENADLHEPIKRVNQEYLKISEELGDFTVTPHPDPYRVDYSVFASEKGRITVSADDIYVYPGDEH